MKQQRPARSRATAAEISASLGISRQAVNLRAAKESWPFEEQTCRGGRRRLYKIDELPRDIRDQLLLSMFDRALSRPQESAPAHPALYQQEPRTLAHPGPHAPADLSTRGGVSIPFLPGDSETGATSLTTTPLRSTFSTFSTSSTSYSDNQRSTASARAQLLAEVKRLEPSFGLNRAVVNLVQLAAAGQLPASLQELVPLANARRDSLSRSTVFRWLRMEKADELAPAAAGRDYALADDVAQVLAIYRQPNKPSLAWCAQEIARSLGLDGWRALYNRADRFRKKLPAPLFHVGRHTGAALKALQPFKRREFLSLAPNDVWVGDGHGAKLKVAHPITGSPFQPEVTVILDVATRFVVGWSVALSENCLAVADALRHGVARHGIPLIYYSDGGAGQTNKMLDAPITGTLGALGVHHEVGRPGNPQGRGVIERFWQTLLIPLARRFETFQGKSADRDTLRLVSREIERALRAAKKGSIAALPAKLPGWQQFIEALEVEIHAYNEEHRHRSLPKNFTPALYRAAKLQGAEIHKPQGAELATLFMPSIMRRARRGEVQLFNGIYFSRDLMLVDGEDVQVAYDIHDASRVWVKKGSGELIAEAVLDGNRDGYMPKPLIERLRDQRAARRMGRLQAQMDEVEAELQGATLVAAPALEPLEIPADEKVIALPKSSPRRPMWDSDAEKFRWLMEHTAEVALEDENWLGWYRGTAEWRDLFGERPAGDGEKDVAATGL